MSSNHKKIGIITFWWSKDNYGQILQCYALQKFLIQLGYEPFLIKYFPKAKNQITLKSYLKKCITFFKLLTCPLKLFAVLKVIILQNKATDSTYGNDRHFDEFLKNNIVSTSQLYSSIDLYKNPPIADVYITGSDQVWNGLDPVYYLDFCPAKTKCISYAASFGKEKFDKSFYSSLSKLIAKFDVITVREESGIKICKNAGRNDAINVPDPTCLLLKNDYLSIAALPKSKMKYLFLYLVGNEICFDLSEIFIFAQKQGLTVIYVASQARSDNYPKIFPTIEEWLGWISEAEYVITNSFHGTVFSLLFEKKFLTIPLVSIYKDMNDRVEALLNRLGLSTRMNTTGLNTICEEINYEYVREKMDVDRKYVEEMMKIWIK